MMDSNPPLVAKSCNGTVHVGVHEKPITVQINTVNPLSD